MEVMSRVVLTVSLLCWGICSSEAKVTCKDKNGGEVDWYILYKVPKPNNKAPSGLEYFYIDSAKNEWPGPIKRP
uniref:deoxyribonuclease II n=1 Tax=Anguilla anguilla TaxID=7936 RepID=A0A0E9RDI2_ANGAN